VNEPLEFDAAPNYPELWIHPGDIAVADTQGVVIIPRNHAHQVVDECLRLQTIDAQCLKSLQDGQTLTETFQRFRT